MNNRGKLDQSLPRLAYIGDVPVEASYHGSLLLHRLLERYPPTRLVILESAAAPSEASRRIPHVRYAELPSGLRRLVNTRFHQVVSMWLSLRAGNRDRLVREALLEFEPEGILTVAHGHSWITAATYARRGDIPLHLIVHDDWPHMAGLGPSGTRWLERKFGAIYRGATSRLCVSAGMVEAFERDYGAGGTLLLPQRSATSPGFDEPPARLATPGDSLVFAFGGTINSHSCAQALRTLSKVLLPLGGRIFLYGPISVDAATKAGLLQKNIVLKGLVPPNDFVQRLRAEADVLFLPVSFDPKEESNTRLAFPSKLTEYTASGLPILIHAPQYASASLWAREHDGAAATVGSEAEEALRAEVCRLVGDTEYRLDLGRRALAAGSRCFSYESAMEIFVSSIRGNWGFLD